MCTFNGGKYIKAQLDSIINQSYPIFEIIISDDGSSDNTVNIIEEYIIRNPSIKLTVNSKNVGVNINFRNAIRLASGDYIALSDQDDLWDKDKIFHLIDNLKDNDLIFSNSELFYKDSQVKNYLYNKTPIFDAVSFNFIQYTVGHTCLFKKEFFEYVDKRWSNYITFDSLLGIAAINRNGVNYINKPLTLWRRHENALSSSIETIKAKRGIINYFYSFSLVLSSKNRSYISKYFNSILPLMGEKTDSYYLTFYMANFSLINMIRACLITFKHRKYIIENKSNRVLMIFRSLWTPIFFYQYVPRLISFNKKYSSH